MDSFINIFLIMDTLLMASTIWAAIYFKRYKNRIGKIQVGRMDTGKIYILLPALREQKIVKETLDHFSKLGILNCQIIVITSEKEEHENEVNNTSIKTTGQCVEEYIKNSNSKSIIHFHCPYTMGTKSTQLNYAVNKIKRTLSEKEREHSYLGIYDFDSMPNLEVLGEFQRLVVSQNFPEIIQQVPVNLKNIDAIVWKKNFLMLLHSLQSNIRAVGIELFALLLHTIGIPIPLYCMGAGMYIRFDTLIDNGLFPEPVDDLTLGYRLYLKKKRFTVLPNYNFVDTPETVKALINQDRLIFTGVWSGLNELHIESTLLRKIFMAGTIIHNILLRTILPWIFIGYFLFHLFTHNINWQCTFIFLYPALRTIIGAFTVVINDKSKVKLLKKSIFYKSLVCSFLWRPIRTIGAIKILPRLILKKQIIYKKTER